MSENTYEQPEFPTAGGNI